MIIITGRVSQNAIDGRIRRRVVFDEEVASLRRIIVKCDRFRNDICCHTTHVIQDLDVISGENSVVKLEVRYRTVEVRRVTPRQPS